MSEEWRSINDFYFVRKKKEESTQAVDLEDEPMHEQDDSPEVRLSDGKFLPGDEGFQFNKKCKAQIKVDYKKETSRKKVVYDLYVIYEDEEEDLGHQVEACEKDGYAEADITLYYGDKYNQALQKNPSAKCYYKFKARHSKGEKEIESELLEMPVSEKVTFSLRFNIDPEDPEVQDDTFRLFSTDENKTYDKTLTVKNDKITENEFLDLEFEEVDTALSYTLEVDPGAEGSVYYLFEDTPFEELKK